MDQSTIMIALVNYLEKNKPKNINWIRSLKAMCTSGVVDDKYVASELIKMYDPSFITLSCRYLIMYQKKMDKVNIKWQHFRDSKKRRVLLLPKPQIYAIKTSDLRALIFVIKHGEYSSWNVDMGSLDLSEDVSTRVLESVLYMSFLK